jgi:hypothetical protein
MHVPNIEQEFSSMTTTTARSTGVNLPVSRQGIGFKGINVHMIM